MNQETESTTGSPEIENDSETRQRRIDFYPYLMKTLVPFAQERLEKISRNLSEIKPQDEIREGLSVMEKIKGRISELLKTFSVIREPVPEIYIRDIKMVSPENSKTETDLMPRPIESNEDGLIRLTDTDRALMKEYSISMRHYFNNIYGVFSGWIYLWETDGVLPSEYKTQVAEIQKNASETTQRFAQYDQLCKQETDSVYLTEDCQAIDLEKTLSALDKVKEENGASEN